MFTGIVSAVGRVESVSPNGGSGTREGGRVLRIRAPYRGLKKGESVAVNGACLTVEKLAKGGFTVHAVQTTLGRTLIGEWQKGQAVNLERALRAGDRLGGHFVEGHVDGVGTVAGVAEVEDAMLDRKSTRLNSSHGYISYAVFCLKKKKKHYITT